LNAADMMAKATRAAESAAPLRSALSADLGPGQMPRVKVPARPAGVAVGTVTAVRRCPQIDNRLTRCNRTRRYWVRA
jgi:hypothetical protein